MKSPPSNVISYHLPFNSYHDTCFSGCTPRWIASGLVNLPRSS